MLDLSFTTAPGLYHGSLNFESASDDLVDGAQLLLYPTITTSPSGAALGSPLLPLSMALTEFHFVLLYRDRVVGLSNLNEQLAYEEMLPLVLHRSLANFENANKSLLCAA